MQGTPYQSGMDQPGRGDHLTSDFAAPLRVDSDKLEAFRYLVREELRLGCTVLSDIETGADELAEADVIERLALFGRLSRDAERGLTAFALSADERPSFRVFMRDVLFTEREDQGAADESGDVLLAVASTERVELIEALAAQIGLF